jgi:cytochrome c553
MKKLFLFAVLCMPGLIIAAPSSLVAWTPETLNLVKKGDPIQGKRLADTCTGCHGEKGVSPIPSYPSLAGQSANYIYKQLRDYATKHRSSALMVTVAQGLSKKDMADIAAWFNSLPAAEKKISNQTVNKAEKLVFKGDSKRVLTPCFLCHGKKGKGEKMDTPALAGQQAEYFVQTLKAYKSGERHNDLYSRMRLISKQLSEPEIQQLGKYYQSLGE